MAESAQARRSSGIVGHPWWAFDALCEWPTHLFSVVPQWFAAQRKKSACDSMSIRRMNLKQFEATWKNQEKIDDSHSRYCEIPWANNPPMHALIDLDGPEPWKLAKWDLQQGFEKRYKNTQRIPMFQESHVHLVQVCKSVKVCDTCLDFEGSSCLRPLDPWKNWTNWGASEPCNWWTGMAYLGQRRTTKLWPAEHTAHIEALMRCIKGVTKKSAAQSCLWWLWIFSDLLGRVVDESSASEGVDFTFELHSRADPEFSWRSTWARVPAIWIPGGHGLWFLVWQWISNCERVHCIYNYMPVVPHEAVAEVSRTRNL